MTRKAAIIIGFDHKFTEELASAGIKVVCQIGTEKSSGLEQFEFVPHEQYVRYTRPQTTYMPLPHALFEKIHAACYREFVRCLSRYVNTSQLLNDWHDSELLFRKSIAMALELFTGHKPDCLIFASIPHRANTVALFGTAQALGIETAICNQSQFAGRIWITEHWRDHGIFSSSRRGKPVQIDVAAPQAMPFYMRKIRGSGEKQLRALAKFAEFSLRYLLAPFDLAICADNTRLNKVLDEVRNAGQMLKYNANKRRAPFLPFADLPERFVYFPLHLQPEMTTDITGGNYANQIAALEAVRQMVPADIAIIVKENPKQNGLMRGPLFWQQLALIPKVFVTGETTSSLELITRSLATAVITGTAGWEALRSGKPVIVLGNTFWRRLPGAFHIDEGASWHKVAAFRFDRKALAKAVAEMSRHSYEGITDFDYAEIVENFDADENRRKLADSLRQHFAAADARRKTARKRRPDKRG